MLEASFKAGESAVLLHYKRVSDTQTHQIAARKEKQMEVFRAALGIGSPGKNQKPGKQSDHEEINDDVKLENFPKSGDNTSDKVLVGDAIDEQYNIEKGVKYMKNEVQADGIRSSKHQKKYDSSDSDTSQEHVKKSRKKHEKIRGSHHHDGCSPNSESNRGHVKQNRKKHHRQTSDSDDKSDTDVQKIRRKSSGKHEKNRRHDTEDSEYDDEKDDKSRWRGGLDNETCRHEEKDDKSRLRGDSEYKSDIDSGDDYKRKQVEPRNVERKFADDKEDDLPKAKSRILIYETETKRNKDLPRDTKTEINNRSHSSRADQMDEYKTKRSGGEREDKRRIKDEDHSERKKSRDEDYEKERNYKRDDKEDQRKSKDEGGRLGRKHKRDDNEEETYKHDTTKELQRGRHGKQQDNRSHEKDRPSGHFKRARYEDCQSTKRYDSEKCDDRRSRH